jgi:tetratricopeptide (TPR) repeat protein
VKIYRFAFDKRFETRSSKKQDRKIIHYFHKEYYSFPGLYIRNLELVKKHMEVTAWSEKVSIPTYRVGLPEKNPMFLEKRVYQGSSGVVYPHPVIEQIADEKTDQEYQAVFLENEYLRIMILPELGGRVQRAYDKVRGRDFIYYNQVIKPALVGLAGPWISGGIEFNWPQHHRPSTFSPVDYCIEANADGSKTVWVNEVEVLFRTRGMAGFRLYPGRAYLEIAGRLFNRTPFPQTFLWWANPAVKVSEHYQSVFPPDVYAVFDHGKRDVSDFPIATGTYYKVDYAPGTDISRYANIPVPTSYMAIRSNYDFMGCYEHDTGAGMLHVANHHLSPGKKQWTWGNGDFGRAWDRNLTDEDGPYIELMTGVFTDNQPDFSWLQPNEGKSFEQYFMPYTQVGVVKNATKEAMLNLEWAGGELVGGEGVGGEGVGGELGAGELVRDGLVAGEWRIKVYATAVYPDARIRLMYRGRVMREFVAGLSPRDVFEESVAVGTPGRPEDWRLVVADSEERELVSWQPEVSGDQEMKSEVSGDQERKPKAAVAARPPAEIGQVEDLYLTGLHLEQYRHATFNPIDYYMEGLRRSPEDIRCNNAMGLLLLRRGQFAKAEPYLRRAVASITRRNPNPYDGEPYYNLGWALKLQGRLDEAYDAFYKAVWNDAWQHSGFLALARIATAKGRWVEALQLVEKSLLRNYHSPVARHLKAVILRKMGVDLVAAFIRESVAIDLFNVGCLFEQYLNEMGGKDPGVGESTAAVLGDRMRDAVNNYLELALDYAQAGLYEEADRVLDFFSRRLAAAGQTVGGPLVHYYRGWLAGLMGDAQKALAHYRCGAAADPACCFPNKIEEVLILQDAMRSNPQDARAPYYLGNLWYDKRQYEDAIACWREAAQRDDQFPTVFRNLALAYYNKLGDKAAALAALEKAFALDNGDARVLMELDQLYKMTGRGFADRLQLLESHSGLVQQRDDLYLERITLYNNIGEYEKARRLLAGRRFHPWEGGEGKVVGQYLICMHSLARKALLRGDYQRALELVTATGAYPENLGEGKLYGARENDRHYLLGCAYEGLNEREKAREYFERATAGMSVPVQAIYYNDPQPDQIVYQALAWRKLGRHDRAESIFRNFVAFGEAHLSDSIAIDYFAVSLPDMLVFEQDLNRRNFIHCTYLIGLGYLGMGEEQKGTASLQEVLKLDINHQGAALHSLFKL